MVRLLVEAGCDLTLRYMGDVTALDAAEQAGHQDTVAVLQVRRSFGRRMDIRMPSLGLCADRCVLGLQVPPNPLHPLCSVVLRKLSVRPSVSCSCGESEP